MDEPDPMPWPKQGAKLFGPAQNWELNACLYHAAWQHERNFSLYAEGYRRAADFIVDGIRAERGSVDYVLYPVAFLYRQSLELYLKLFIRMAADILRLRGTDVAKVKWTGHRLGPLWNQAKALAASIDPIPADVRPAIDEAILEFESVDRSSMAFRYPLDLEGEALLSPDIKLINLSQLQDGMGRIANFFSCATSHYGTILDHAEDDRQP